MRQVAAEDLHIGTFRRWRGISLHVVGDACAPDQFSNFRAGIDRYARPPRPQQRQVAQEKQFIAQSLFAADQHLFAGQVIRQHLLDVGLAPLFRQVHKGRPAAIGGPSVDEHAVSQINHAQQLIQCQRVRLQVGGTCQYTQSAQQVSAFRQRTAEAAPG